MLHELFITHCKKLLCLFFIFAFVFCYVFIMGSPVFGGHIFHNHGKLIFVWICFYGSSSQLSCNLTFCKLSTTAPVLLLEHFMIVLCLSMFSSSIPNDSFPLSWAIAKAWATVLSLYLLTLRFISHFSIE